VAHDFTQLEGVDYQETFSPVAKLVTVRCLLATASVKGWHLHQFDVNNAFLHGDLHEDIYMNKPRGYTKGSSTQVCKLLKSLYVLKQASRQWYSKFSNVLFAVGFSQSKADYSLFTRDINGTFVVILVYVDDILVTNSDITAVQELKSIFHRHFQIKDLGLLRYFLGIEVARSSKGIYLCQRKYTLDILANSDTSGSTPATVPMQQNLNLTQTTDTPLSDPSIYRRLIGRLLYLTVSRPDICYSVNNLSQFMANPTDAHLHATHKVLCYLKGAPG
jgi:hypothetical protein